MGRWERCPFYPCDCGNKAEYDPGDMLVHHIRMTRTRKEIMDKAKELGISDNPWFESQFILCVKIAELSVVDAV